MEIFILLLVLGDNELEGNVPTEFALIQSIVHLGLGPNDFVHPTFPTEFMSMPALGSMCEAGHIRLLHASLVSLFGYCFLPCAIPSYATQCSGGH